jgi:hypothetical protein
MECSTESICVVASRLLFLLDSLRLTPVHFNSRYSRTLYPDPFLVSIDRVDQHRVIASAALLCVLC